MEPLALRKSGAQAGCGFILCLGLAATLLGIGGVSHLRNRFFAMDDSRILTGYFLLLAFLLLSLLVLLLALVNRPIQIHLRSEGIEDHRLKQGMIRWQDIAEIRLRGKRDDAMGDDTLLIVELRNGETVTIDLEGLNRTPEAIFQRARTMRLDA